MPRKRAGGGGVKTVRHTDTQREKRKDTILALREERERKASYNSGVFSWELNSSMSHSDCIGGEREGEIRREIR